MEDLTTFIRHTLIPAAFDRIGDLLPSMGFVFRHGEWQSPRNMDGSTPKNHRLDKTVVTSKYPGTVLEHGEGGTDSLLNVYMREQGISHIIEAVNSMCSDLGIKSPFNHADDPEYNKKWKAYKERQDKWMASFERQKAALLTPCGNKAMEYMKSRGWTEDEVKRSGIGYIDSDEAHRLGLKDGRIGTEYVLSIPLFSAGQIYGFKFRYVPTAGQADKNPKYLFIEGLERDIFGLKGVKTGTPSVVVVEGELDALRAQVNGLDNFIATCGGGLKSEYISAIKAKGVKDIYLLLDNDKAGNEYTRTSIQAVNEAGLECFVCSIPSGDKDVDSYLNNHTIADLQSIIARSEVSYKYLYRIAIEAFFKDKEDGSKVDVTDTEFIKLQREIFDIANNTRSEVARDTILGLFSQQIEGLPVSRESLKADADRQRREQNLKRQKDETERAARQAMLLSKEGKVKEALEVMRSSYNSLNALDKESKYLSLLSTPNMDSLKERLQRKPNSLGTGYEFKNMNTGAKEALTIPVGAITFICAPTSHGKSTMLQNLALQIAEGESEGTTLYFTFEEDKDSVLLQMINKYVDEELCQQYNPKYSNNLRAITHYWKTGTPKYIKAEKQSIFLKRQTEFLEDFISNGKLRLYYEDFDSTELIEAIKTITKRIKVKAVFIDYIQLLHKNGCRLQRTEELKEICKDLKNLAVDYNLPIVVAAQLNRETKSPIDMHSQNIAEAADLERIANTIVLLWNTSFTAQKATDLQQRNITEFENKLGIKLGQSGYIYAKLSKNRGGMVGIDTVLEYNGNTGVIRPNDPEYINNQNNNLPWEKTEQTPF